MRRVTILASAVSAVVLVVLAVSCATRQTEDLLSAAGFKMVPADTPERQANLETLPKGRITRTQRDGQIYFLYPGQTDNVLYVGNQAEYDQYQKLRVEQHMSQEQLNAAEMNATYWGMWGPWGPWGP
jgi:hypothetical protein